MLRLMSAIGMLVIVGMLIVRTRDPAMWAWWVKDKGEVFEVAGDKAAPKDGAKVAGEKGNGEAGQKDAGKAADVPGKAEPEEDTEGTDLDPEQVEAARTEFQALDDRSLMMRPEEMVPYYRVLGWVLNQPFERLQQRARRDVVYTQLIQWPDKHRGQLLRLKLNVRRILRTEPTDDYDKPLYELWGYTSESGMRFYTAIVPELPEGMPIGPNVYENVWLTGYFFKLQGYYPAGAKPGAAREVAPVLIGRVQWIQRIEPAVRPTDWYWALGAGAAVVLIALAITAVTLVRRRPPRPSILVRAGAKPGNVTTEQWLEMAQSGEAPPSGIAESHPIGPAEPSPPLPNDLAPPPGEESGGNGKPPHSGLGTTPPLP